MTSSSRRSLAAGVALLVLLEVFARLLAPHLPGRLVWDTEFSQVKAAQIADLGKVDLVLLGSSIVNAGLDGPTVTAEVPWAAGSYNAGLPATTPRTWEVWAGDLVFTELCPAVLVLGVSVRDMNDNNSGAAGRLTAYTNSSGRNELLGGAPVIHSLEERVGDWSAFVELRARLREPGNIIKYFATGRVESWPDPNLSDEGRYRGFDERTYERDAARDEELREGAFAEFSMGGTEFDSVRRIIDHAQDLGVDVVLVNMPSMRTDLARLLPDDALPRFEALLSDLGAEYGVPVWSFPELDDRADRFADLYHPNGTGTTELSRLLGERLEAAFPERPTVSKCGSPPAPEPS